MKSLLPSVRAAWVKYTKLGILDSIDLLAIKILPPERVADPERKRRFVRGGKLPPH